MSCRYILRAVHEKEKLSVGAFGGGFFLSVEKKEGKRRGVDISVASFLPYSCQ